MLINSLHGLLARRVRRILHHGSRLFPSLKIFEKIVHFLYKCLTIGSHLARLHDLFLQGGLFPHKILILVQPGHEIFLLFLGRHDRRCARRVLLSPLTWWQLLLLQHATFFLFLLLSHVDNPLSEIGILRVLE